MFIQVSIVLNHTFGRGEENLQKEWTPCRQHPRMPKRVGLEIGVWLNIQDTVHEKHNTRQDSRILKQDSKPSPTDTFLAQPVSASTVYLSNSPRCGQKVSAALREFLVSREHKTPKHDNIFSVSETYWDRDWFEGELLWTLHVTLFPQWSVLIVQPPKDMNCCSQWL
jgi:hypothetical protein